MGRARVGRLGSLWLWGAMILWAGCGPNLVATFYQTPPRQLLLEAGFQKRPAVTPQQVAELGALPQRKFIILRKQGRTRYVYADAADCRCLYLGNAQAYQRFKDLLAQKEISYNPLEISSPGTEVPFSWGIWEDMQGAE